MKKITIDAETGLIYETDAALDPESLNLQFVKCFALPEWVDEIFIVEMLVV